MKHETADEVSDAPVSKEYLDNVHERANKEVHPGFRYHVWIFRTILAILLLATLFIVTVALLPTAQQVEAEFKKK